MSQLQQSQSQRMYAQPKMLAEYAAPSFWIRYKPDRLQKRTNRILSFLISLGIAAVAASFFTWRNDGYFILNGYLFLLITAFVLMIVSGPLKRLALVILPNHIELNEKGLRFHWMHLFLRASTPLINWERVSHVTTKITKVADVEEVTLEFNAIARGFTMKERLLYFMLAPALSWGWLTSDRAQIHFKVDGIASSDDRKRLQTGLKKFLPSYRIDPKVADDLNIFIKFDSYTDLWLDKLQDSSESDRKAALEDGAVLNNGEYKILEQIGAGGQAIVYRALMFKKLADSAALMSLTRGETRVDLDDLAGLKQESSKKSQPAVQKETSNDGAVETPEKLPVTVATENIKPEANAAGGDPSDENAPYMVVLKEFILPVQAGSSIRKRVLENIQKEAKLWHKLKHPNIGRLIDFFIEGQRVYLVLEYAEGKTLKRVVTECGAMPEEQAVKLAIQMCDILGYLHRKQPAVVHRDFTPDNLIVDEDGKVKLIDFNVALQLEAQTTKTVVGKHAYIPPEQFRGKAVPQSDLYALGGTIFFMLTGVDPEPITEAHPRLYQLKQNGSSTISEAVDAIVAKTTALTVATRYQDCHELKTDLLQVVESFSMR